MNQQEPAGRPAELLLIPATSVMWGDCEILHAVAKNGCVGETRERLSAASKSG